jgi:hypothetical protein
MKDNSSPALETKRYSMSQETKIVKDKTFMHGEDTEVPIRDGELFILTELERKRQRDSAHMDSTLEEHSTSDQECQ